MKTIDYVKAFKALANETLDDEHIKWVPAPKRKGQSKSPGSIPYVNKIAFFGLLDKHLGPGNWDHGTVEHYLHPEGYEAVMSYVTVNEETENGIIVHKWTGVAEVNAYNKQAPIRSAETTSISHIARAMWAGCRILWWDAEDEDAQRYPVKGKKPTLAQYLDRPDDWNKEDTRSKKSKTRHQSQQDAADEDFDDDDGIDYAAEVKVIMETIYKGNSVKEAWIDKLGETKGGRKQWEALAADVADRIWTEATGGELNPESGMMSNAAFEEIVRWKVSTAKELQEPLQDFDLVATSEELVALHQEVNRLYRAVPMLDRIDEITPYELVVTHLNFTQDKNGMLFCVATSTQFPYDRCPYQFRVMEPHIMLGVDPKDIIKLESKGMVLQEPYVGNYELDEPITMPFHYMGDLILENAQTEE